MSPVGHPSATLCTLALLVMAGVPGTLARPSERDTTSPLLDITTSIKLGGPILGEMIGPFASGKILTITCSTKSLGTVSLSWWEDGKQLEAERRNVSTSLTLTLWVTDSGRRFTCQDSVTQAEKSVKLHVVEQSLVILKGGEVLQDEQVLNVSPGDDLNLNCVVQGYNNPSPGSWWEGEEMLHATTWSYPTASSSQLVLRSSRFRDSWRKLSCRALEGQLSRTVVVRVERERKDDAPQSPTETTKATTTTISPSSSTKTIQRNISSISETVPDDGGTSPKVNPEKSTVRTGENESFDTSIPDGQGTPVSETVSNANSVMTTTTENSLERNEMPKYVIAGGAAITFIGLVVVILIFVILKLCRTINKLDTSTSQQQGNSCEQRALAYSSVQNTLTSLDPQNLPPLSPLLPRHPPVEGGDETASPGGRMSAVMPDDRDHSYYYPDLINNSYYYPKITDDVRREMLVSNSCQ